MVQFYVLTIIFLVIGALILLHDEYGERFPVITRMQNIIFNNQTNTIVLLVLTAVTGLLKMISPIAPGPVVLGDFLPSVTLLSMAVFYTFEMKSLSTEQEDMDEDEILEDASFVDSEIVDKAEGFYYKNKKIIGYVILGVAFFHFLFPGAVLL